MHCESVSGVPPLLVRSFTTSAEPELALPLASSAFHVTSRLKRFCQPDRSVSNPGFARRLGAAMPGPENAVNIRTPTIAAIRPT
jgi:hypothetical protein